MASILEGFLVRLGFEVDKDGLNRFNGHVQQAGRFVSGLTKTAVAAGTAISAAFVQATSSVDDLYKASNNSGASIKSLETIRQAVERVGGSSEAVGAAFDSLAMKIKSQPGFEDYLKANFGVGLTDATGKLRDMGEVFLELREKLAKMAKTDPGLARVQADAIGLGGAFDDLMRKDFPAEMEKAKSAMDAWGESLDKNAERAHGFMNSFDRLWEAVKTGTKTVAMDVLEVTGVDKWVEDLADKAEVALPSLATAAKEGMDSYKKGEWTVMGVIGDAFADAFKNAGAAQLEQEAEESGSPEVAALSKDFKEQRAKEPTVGDRLEKRFDDAKATVLERSGKKDPFEAAAPVKVETAEPKEAPTLDEQIRQAEEDGDVGRMMELLKQKREAPKDTPPAETKTVEKTFEQTVTEKPVEVASPAPVVKVNAEAPTVEIPPVVVPESPPATVFVDAPKPVPFDPKIEVKPVSVQDEQSGQKMSAQPVLVQMDPKIDVQAPEVPAMPMQVPAPSRDGEIDGELKVDVSPIKIDSEEERKAPTFDFSPDMQPPDVVVNVPPQPAPTVQVQQPKEIAESKFAKVRGFRNNNPGNLRSGRGQVGKADGFAQFASMADGYRAMSEQLKMYQNAGLENIASLVKKWAPPTENDTVSYIQSVVKSMRKDLGNDLNATDKIDLSDTRVLGSLVDAMIDHENGSGASQYFQGSAYQAALGEAAASKRASKVVGAGDKIPSGNTFTIQQSININGAQSPQQVAQAIDAQTKATVNRNASSNPLM